MILGEACKVDQSQVLCDFNSAVFNHPEFCYVHVLPVSYFHGWIL